MNISIWYVFLDDDNEWIAEGTTSDNWHDAKEFYTEREAQKVAEREGGVVFGWCQ